MKKKFVLLCFGILTIFWLIASYQHVRAYNQMKQEDIEMLGEEVAELIDYYPVWMYGAGEVLLVIGLFVVFGWIIIIFEILKKVKTLWK